MMRPRTKTIPGFQIQPMLPMRFPYFGATILEADFTEHCGQPCVEALVQLGLIKNPYTLVLTLHQAREADIIETV